MAATKRMLTPADYEARRAAIEASCAKALVRAANPHPLWRAVASFRGRPFTHAQMHKAIARLYPLGNGHPNYNKLNVNHELALMAQRGLLLRVADSPVRVPETLIAGIEDQQAKELAKEYLNGASLPELVRRHKDISYSTIRKRLRTHGVPLRTRSPNGALTRYQAAVDTTQLVTEAKMRRDALLATLEAVWRESPFYGLTAYKLRKLSNTERQVIERRISGETLAQIGARWGTTREAIRQVQAKAFERLRES